MFGNKLNNSGWILCPSKRFPGKFYYYNVVTGESAWSFNETEKKFLSIDDKTKLMSQKWHCYPEPLSPPGKGLNCFTGSSFLLPQQFGRVSFPKYFSPAAHKFEGFGAINSVSNARNPSVIKAPIFSIQNVHKTLVPKKNVDIQTDLPETEVIVQSCEEPLSKRFLKYHSNESEEKNLEILNEKYFESSKVFKNSKNEPQMVQSAEHSQENLSLSTPNSVHNSSNSDKTNLTSKVQLADNDLRYILQAKKFEKKKNEPIKKSTVKKVRFDLTSIINDDENEYHSEEEIAMKDAYNAATERIVEHIPNAAKSDNFVEIQHHNIIEDDLKNFKFVVKNTNPQNQFQQEADEYNPFQFKDEKIINLGKVSSDQNVENSVNVINENQYLTSTPNDSYKNDDNILNVTKTMKEKLYVRVPNQFGANPKILFLKSTPQDNPFKKYKSKTNPYLKCKSAPKAFTSLFSFASNKLNKNNFKVPFNKAINTFEHKATSSKDVNYFDPKLFSNNLNTGHLNNNYISQSGYAKDQKYSGYTNNNSKVADGCMIFGEKNKIDNKDPKHYSNNLNTGHINNNYISQSGYAKDQKYSGYTNNNSKVADGCTIFGEKNKIDNKDPKHYSNNLNTGHLNNNYISQSGYAKDQKYSGYTNNNSKVADGCTIFGEKNKIDNKDHWLDHKLKNFYTRNSYIESTVKVRMDEIICFFTQIIENIIHEILETSTCPPPYSLYDAILCLQRKFSDHTHILQVVDRITDLDIFCSKTGYLKKNVHPHELIKALGCGLVFIEALNESEEYDVKDGEDALLQLLRDIEEPEYVELPHPTTVSRDGSTEQLNRTNFVKERSEILNYLRNHFPGWKNYNEEHDQTPNTNSTHNVVMTTTGKDLHLYKINSKNQIYREPEDVQETNEFNDKECDKKKVIAKFHIIEEFENRIKVNPENESTQSKHNQEIIEDVSDEGKLVIDERTPEELYEDDANKCSEESFVLLETANEVNQTKPDSPRIDTSIRINESSTITDDFPVLINDPVTHIYADDADQYYFLVKTFLTELSNCLLSIHAFIKDNAERMHDTDLTYDDRKEIHENANQIYIDLKNIILELKSIVERETCNENALKILLMSADGALQDKRITNYRQVTAKCVEQARHLAGCVRLLLRATDRDCTLSASSDAGTTCINIFE